MTNLVLEDFRNLVVEVCKYTLQTLGLDHQASPVFDVIFERLRNSKLAKVSQTNNLPRIFCLWRFLPARKRALPDVS